MYRCIDVCMYVYMCICIDVCIDVYMYICMYICIYVCMYVYMCICIDVYMYVCIDVWLIDTDGMVQCSYLHTLVEHLEEHSTPHAQLCMLDTTCTCSRF